MKSLLSRLRMHWDHEPWKAPASRTHSKRFAKSRALGHRAAAFGVRGACSRFRTRFMESLLSLLRMHWDHEPTPSPSQEGNGQDADRCLFPSWEGLGVGRFMERAIQFPKGTSAANRARRVLLMSARFVVPFLICQLVCTARIAAAET